MFNQESNMSTAFSSWSFYFLEPESSLLLTNKEISLNQFAIRANKFFIAHLNLFAIK